LPQENGLSIWSEIRLFGIRELIRHFSGRITAVAEPDDDDGMELAILLILFSLFTLDPSRHLPEAKKIVILFELSCEGLVF
jgi:hypothetical protein